MRFTVRSVSSWPRTPPSPVTHEAGFFWLSVLAALLHQKRYTMKHKIKDSNWFSETIEPNFSILYFIICFKKEFCGLELLCDMTMSRSKLTFAKVIDIANQFLSKFCAVYQVPEVLYPWGAPWLCPLLRGAVTTDVCQWNSKSAPKLAGIAGHQIQAAHHAPDHLHGWK